MKLFRIDFVEIAVVIDSRCHLDATLAQELDVAREVLCFSNHYPSNAELKDRAGAHHARTQGRVHRGLRVVGPSSGVLHAVGLAVGNGILVLHPAVASARHHFSVLDHERADRHAAFVESGTSFLEGEAHEITVFRGGGSEGHTSCLWLQSRS